MLQRMRSWARALEAQLVTVYFLAVHPATPRLAKVVAGLTLAYALSPIDLIPDFIPVLGLLDDLLLVPLGLWLALRLTPEAVRRDCASRASEHINSGQRLPASRIAAIVIVFIWLALAGLAWWIWLK